MNFQLDFANHVHAFYINIQLDKGDKEGEQKWRKRDRKTKSVSNDRK